MLRAGRGADCIPGRHGHDRVPVAASGRRCAGQEDDRSFLALQILGRVDSRPGTLRSVPECGAGRRGVDAARGYRGNHPPLEHEA